MDDKSRLLLWYAGHGGTTENYSFLVPVNAPNKSSRAFKNKVLSLDRFKELSGKAEAKHVLVVFDSCFSGTIFSASRGVLGDPITGRGLRAGPAIHHVRQRRRRGER